jgi:hypothetical protein
MLADLLAPIQEKRMELQKDKKHIQEILLAGKHKASILAAKTMEEVRGLLKI